MIFQKKYKHLKINIKKTKILFITFLFLILLSLKSNVQTNSTQTLDEKYPYYYVFWETEEPNDTTIIIPHYLTHETLQLGKIVAITDSIGNFLYETWKTTAVIENKKLVVHTFSGTKP